VLLPAEFRSVEESNDQGIGEKSLRPTSKKSLYRKD